MNCVRNADHSGCIPHMPFFTMIQVYFNWNDPYTVVKADSMLTLAFIKQVYTKTKPNLNALNELFLELEAVSGHQNSTEQLLFTSS